jgi:uncharacterized surface anchored protein
LAGLLGLALIVPSFASLSSVFENEGNLADDPDVAGKDWSSVGIDCTPATTEETTPTPVKGCKIDLPTGQGDDSFGQGTKEDTEVPSPVLGSIPNNKSDLTRFYVANEAVNSGTTTLNYLYLAWERVQDPSGTTNMDFEFNQSSTLSANGKTPVRTAGDILIKYDLANGGTNPTMGYHTWLTSGASAAALCEASSSFPCWGKLASLTGNFNATIASESVTDPIWGPGQTADRTVGTRTFGEASIDLTTAQILPTASTTDQCRGFGSAYLKSRSSDSFTAAVKDYVAPLPVNITNCGRLKIKKTVSGTGATLAGARFKVYKDDGDGQLEIGQVVGGVTMGTGDLPALKYESGTTSADVECTTAKTTVTATDGIGNCTYAVFQTGNYWVVETEAPTGYVLKDLPTTPEAVTLGQTVEVGITNTPATRNLSISKIDDNNGPVGGATFALYGDPTAGGAFSSSTDTAVSGKSCTTATATSATGVTPVTVLGSCTITGLQVGTSYWVLETSRPGGYGPDTAKADCTIASVTYRCYNTGAVATGTGNLTVSFTNPRQFKVITLVCNTVNNTLYKSSVNFDGTATADTKDSMTSAQLTTFNTAQGTANKPTLDQTTLCSLATGAVFSPKGASATAKTGSVTIPVAP